MSKELSNNRKEMMDLETLLKEKFAREQKANWAKKLKDEYGVERSTFPEKSKIRLRPILIWTVGIAASIMLLYLSFSSVLIPSPSTLAQNYLSENTYPFAGVRKNLLGQEEIRMAAIDAYINKDFKNAISFGEKLIGEGKGNETDQFFLGLSYLYSQDYSSAINQFKLMAQKGDPNEQQFDLEARWFLALSYVLNEQGEEAKKLLSKFQPGDWNFEIAQKMRRKLK